MRKSQNICHTLRWARAETVSPGVLELERTISFGCLFMCDSSNYKLWTWRRPPVYRLIPYSQFAASNHLRARSPNKAAQSPTNWVFGRVYTEQTIITDFMRHQPCNYTRYACECDTLLCVAACKVYRVRLRIIYLKTWLGLTSVWNYMLRKSRAILEKVICEL